MPNEKTIENFKNMGNTIKCKICGAEENLDKWNEECKEQLKERQMCFTCNHWQNNYEKDMAGGTHDYAIFQGKHYRLLGEDECLSPFKGHGGVRFIFKFKDKAIRECRNVWCQGDIPEGYWREKMPDNVESMW